MRKGTCRHFNGIGIGRNGGDEKICEAGVCYRKLVGGDATGWATRIPCITGRDSEPKRGERAVCDKFQEPSADEIAAYDDEWKQHMAKFTLSFPLISDVKKEHKGKDWSGVKECPACKGKLHMSHAAYNGHVHGQCETKNCLSWME